MTEPETIGFYTPPKPDQEMLKRMSAEVGKSKMVSNGPLCREFEGTIRDHHNARYALACSSATTGLLIALKAARRLTDAQECLIPAFAWESCQWAAEGAGLNVVFGDCDMNNWMLGPLERKGQIIMPVSVFGAKVDPKLYEGNIIIDAAHAVGTLLDIGGTLGAVFSFAPSKILTCGDGGMFVTNDSKMAALFSEYRDKFGRLSELNAAMGLAHWAGLPSYLRDRKNRWQKYRSAIKGTPQVSGATNHSTAAFRIKNRDAMVESLRARGIESRVYYKPLCTGLPATDKLYEEVICLPNWLGCPTDRVLKALGEIYS